MTSYPGFFISLEGVDGCGKSTQAALLAKWLSDATDKEVILTREPGGTELGIALRQLIQHGEDMDARTESLLYAADRAHHVARLIRPALERGAIVVTDRYFDSSIAYQSAGRHLPSDQIELLSLWATNALLPDVSVLIEVDPEVAATRFTGELDRIELAGVEFQKRVQRGYLTRVNLEPTRWHTVPGEGSPEQVFAELKAAITPKLTAWLES